MKAFHNKWFVFFSMMFLFKPGILSGMSSLGAIDSLFDIMRILLCFVCGLLLIKSTIPINRVSIVLGLIACNEVWKILLAIPYGSVITYGEIADIMAKKRGAENMSAQAIGGAVGHNPISIIIPCHRVVGSNGSLTGYAGGLETKIKLLELEGVDMSGLFRPQKGTAL